MGHFSTLLLLALVISIWAERKPTRNVEITAEEEKLRDAEGFAAISELHRLMDDDHSGSIDRFESADFLKEDLKIGGGSDRARREKAFHHNNDESITVDDLWEAWFQSEERNWSDLEVSEWLENVVRLPQYKPNFLSAKVAGIALPRQKLQLKALDLVLFGFQDGNSRIKDIALAALLVLLISVLIVFKTHRTRSKLQMAELSSKLSELKSMENDFEGAEQKLEESRRYHSIVESQEHIEALKNQLMEAERRIEMNGYDSIPFSLQPLLRRTYELESSYINTQKYECLSEMREAKDFVDKMRRRQTGIMASFKIATGTTSGTDEIDIKIFELKGRMEKIKMAMDECQQRWMEVESLCGFSITGPFGVTPSNATMPTSASTVAGSGSMDHGIGYGNKDAIFFDSGRHASSTASFDATSGVFSENSSVNGTVHHSHLRHYQLGSSAQKNLPVHKLSEASAPMTLNDSSSLISHKFQSHKASSITNDLKKLSDDSSSLSSSNDKGKGDNSKKSKRISHFIKRKLSKN